MYSLYFKVKFFELLFTNGVGSLLELNKSKQTWPFKKKTTPRPDVRLEDSTTPHLSSLALLPVMGLLTADINTRHMLL